MVFSSENDCTHLLRCAVLAAKYMYRSQFQTVVLEAGMLRRGLLSLSGRVLNQCVELIR
jgi:hypothetical protein